MVGCKFENREYRKCTKKKKYLEGSKRLDDPNPGKQTLPRIFIMRRWF